VFAIRRSSRHSVWMALRLAETPTTDRPRERLWTLGPQALTSPELLAVLLGTGAKGRDALSTAAELLRLVEGSLRQLAARPGGQLLRESGIGPAKAARLLAALELGGRVSREERPVRERIRSPEDVVRIAGPKLRDLPVEEFHLLALDSQSQVLRDVLVTRGLLNAPWSIRGRYSGPPSPRPPRASFWSTTIPAATRPRRRKTGRSRDSSPPPASCSTCRSTTMSSWRATGI